MTDAVFNTDILREDIDLEAKRAGGRDGRGALPNDIWETYSAFANTDGGIILLGIAEKKGGKFEARGIEEPDKVLQDFWTQINNPQKVSQNFVSDSSVRKYPAGNGSWVIEIDVPRATRKQRPVFINGNPMTGTYKRLHGGDFRCSEEEVKRSLAEQTEDERDARILVGYNFDDIDIDSFKAYRNRLASLKPDHPYNTAENLDFMRKVGGWRIDRISNEEGLTLAGLLMFGRHEALHEAVPNYFVDYRELPVTGTKTEWTDRLIPDGTWSGNLYDFYRLVIQRLFRDLKVPFRLEGDEREDDTPVHKALRETLVNAIVHADYSARISILVVKAPGYFGFRNPGRMRIPIEKALEGGHSDCRNRSLQRMFSLIGLGEQAGSGIPRVVENWKTQHYRFPELWESQEPEATLMRLRTVSLLPEETLEELQERFGVAFDSLDENGRLAVATAQIEGYVTNGRLQQICRLHSQDITVLLKRLEKDGFLVHDGQGRGTTYRIAGCEALDLADSVDLSDPARSERPGPSSTHKGATSTHKEGSSTYKGPRSTHKGGDPQHWAESPTITGEDAEEAELLRIAEPVRTGRRTDPTITRDVILRLCRGRFLSPHKLSLLLGRSPQGLRERFIKPMIDEDSLERRFPQQPNHEQQAYKTLE